LIQGENFRGGFLQGEVAVLNQPLVDADAPHQGLGSVVRDHQHGGVFVALLQQFPNPLIHMDVVVVDGSGKGRLRLVLGMAGVHGLPEGMVDAVYPHIHQH
jgi:hypothetical protein